MSLIKCYHGTTYNNYLDIIGGKFKQGSVWNCSFDDNLYVYPLSKVDEDEEDSIAYAIRQAGDNGVIAGALYNSNRVVVIEFLIKDNLLEDDFSSSNMSSSASFIDLAEYDVPAINAVYEVTSYNPELRLLYLHAVSTQPDFNTGYLSNDMNRALDALTGVDLYMDELYDIEYELLEEVSNECKAIS